MDSRDLFFITPLLYDEQLQCASFDVRLGTAAPKTTDSLDMDLLFDLYPKMRSHRCDSGRPRSFFDEARQTETVHLLEHLAVELVALSGAVRSKICGETGIPRTLDSEGQATYRLRFYGVNSLEEMDALLRQAASILGDLISSS